VVAQRLKHTQAGILNGGQILQIGIGKHDNLRERTRDAIVQVEISYSNSMRSSPTEIVSAQMTHFVGDRARMLTFRTRLLRLLSLSLAHPDCDFYHQSRSPRSLLCLRLHSLIVGMNIICMKPTQVNYQFRSI
jgi:hypothetical protein